MSRTNYRDERGIALFVAILALLLLTAIAAGMMYLSSTEVALSSNFKAEETAYFAARAGVEEVRDRRVGAAVADLEMQKQDEVLAERLATEIKCLPPTTRKS